MEQDYGVKVSQNDTSVNDTTKALLMSTKYPFMKLDTTNEAAAKDITLIFNNDPPNPGSGEAPITTKVYSYLHGYDYIPAFWVIGFNQVPPIAAGTSDYFYCDFGLIADNGVPGSAYFSAETTKTHMNFYVTKYFFSEAINMIGAVLRIRSYIFVDSLNE